MQLKFSSRVEEIDVFRAFGIILMIMGHIKFSSISHFSHFIHAFHMPMFFIVSGMFFKYRNDVSIKNFVRKKAKSFLLPYIFFGIFHYLIWAADTIIAGSAVSINPLLHVLFINTVEMPIAGALWFLTAIFFSTVTYFIIHHYVKKDIFQYVCVIMISAFGCISVSILSYRLPYALDAAFVGVGLMHIGYLLKKYKNILYCIFKLKLYQVLLLGIVTAKLIFLNGYVNMLRGSYAIIPLFWINAVLASIVGMNLARITVNILPHWLKDYLCSVGMNSIVYLCLNQVVILFVRRFVSEFIPQDRLLNVVVFVISLAVLYICEKIIMNTGMKKLMGK